MVLNVPDMAQCVEALTCVYEAEQRIAFFVQNSATYWEGKADMESLQRIYGISFPDKKELKQWQKIQVTNAVPVSKETCCVLKFKRFNF